MDPLISEASRQAADARCHRRAENSVCRIGTEFGLRFGVFPCGIVAKQTGNVPAFRRRARGLHPALRAESRPDVAPAVDVVRTLPIYRTGCPGTRHRHVTDPDDVASSLLYRVQEDGWRGSSWVLFANNIVEFIQPWPSPAPRRAAGRTGPLGRACETSPGRKPGTWWPHP